MTEKELKNIKKGGLLYIIFIIILCFIIYLFCSCSTMNTNIMVGATSEYEDKVMFYEPNQEYHQKYDLKLSIKDDGTYLSTENFVIKKL